MSKDTANNLFIDSSMRRFYQHLFKGIASFEELGNRIIREIRAAHAFRQVEQVRELSSVLVNLPIREYQLIGQYYFVWYKCRKLQYDSDALERIIDQTRTHRTKALISRAALEGYQKNIESEFYFYKEASKSQPTVSESIDILKSIAVIKAKEGFHKLALKELENLMPIIRHAEPLIYFDVLNSYAVELGEAGRKDEARNISSIVLASPFAPVYPEWQETARDLREPNRSFIAINQLRLIPDNVIPMPAVEPSSTGQISYNRPARVFNLLQWKKRKMAKGKKSSGKNKRGKQTSTIALEIERTNKIILLYVNRETSSEKRRKIWEAVEQIMSEPDSTEPDDTKGA
jgi:hypothetical protein